MPHTSSVSPRHRWLLLGAAVAIVLLLDQLTKWWAVRSLAPSPEQPLGHVVDVVWTLRFNYAENTGMAFSQGADSGRWIGLLVMVIVVGLVVLGARVHTRAQVVLVGVVIGGALGNLVDRAFRADDGPLSGAVVDFIDFQWWPVFNVADAAVVVGGILLVLVSAREPDGDGDRDGEGEGAEPSAADTKG
jgi:signal peptidase II